MKSSFGTRVLCHGTLAINLSRGLTWDSLGLVNLPTKDCFSPPPHVTKQSRNNWGPCGLSRGCHLGPWTGHRDPTLAPYISLFGVTTRWSLSWLVFSCLHRLRSNKCTEDFTWCLWVWKQVKFFFFLIWMRLLEENTLCLQPNLHLWQACLGKAASAWEV